MRAKRRFGQHFLADPLVIDAIVEGFGPCGGERIVEIGPGAGALTGPLLMRGFRVTAVELDRELADLLRRRFGAGGRLDVVQGDVLEFDLESLAADAPLRVIGNLPYNVSTPILFHLLGQLRLIESMYLMLQREVVERVAASPGGRRYGRLSVMVQRLCEARAELDVPPRAFAPPPKVTSAMLRLRPRRAPLGGEVDSGWFERVVDAAFGQRRKTLRNALAGFATRESIERCGIDPARRAETLGVEEFARLADALARSARG